MGRKRKTEVQAAEDDAVTTNRTHQISAIHTIRNRNQLSSPTPEPDPVEPEHECNPHSSHHNEHAKVQPRIQQLPTFIPSKDSLRGQTEDAVTLRLDGTTLTLVGQYEIWVRKGAVSILGAVLYPSSISHRVFAPFTHSLPTIRPIRNPFGPAEQPVEITISSFHSGIRSLKQVSPMFGLLWNEANVLSNDETLELDSRMSPLNDVRRTYSFLKTDGDDGYARKRPLSLLEIPDDWQVLMTALISRKQALLPTVALVCGPKGSGKSTFARMLVNGVLKSSTVAYLDIDPGQPEFSPPGEVSLLHFTSYNFGPPFCHPAASSNGVKLIRSHHIGSTSPQGNMHDYMQCVLNLFQHYKQLLAKHPSCLLVINTAGWIQGSGLELVSDFIRHLNITDVIYTSTSGPSEVVNSISQATRERNIHLHILTSQPVEIIQRSAADLRAMQTLSYFHLDEPEMGHFRWDPRPIDEMTTLQVHYSGTNQSIYGIQLLGSELDPEFLVQVLEGCIVGLVVVEDDEALHAVLGSQNTNEVAEGPDNPSLGFAASFHNLYPLLPRTPEHIPYIPSTAHITPPLSPDNSHSIGQALVRAIDTKSQVFHLITPVHYSTFASTQKEGRKLVLVKGDLDTPCWAYKEDLHKQMQHRKRVTKEGLEEGGGWTKDDSQRWAEGRPWVSTEARKKGERVRKVRRDLGRKNLK
ncbi:MAG: hypothetical protein L6R40_006692 [Gallowayella cf. fulva]|nr:MAG: hypothetical protein L6R40_006692 [Xanthomendoza cf. fulva]